MLPRVALHLGDGYVPMRNLVKEQYLRALEAYTVVLPFPDIEMVWNPGAYPCCPVCTAYLGPVLEHQASSVFYHSASELSPSLDSDTTHSDPDKPAPDGVVGTSPGI